MIDTFKSKNFLFFLIVFLVVLLVESVFSFFFPSSCFLSSIPTSGVQYDSYYYINNHNSWSGCLEFLSEWFLDSWHPNNRPLSLLQNVRTLLTMWLPHEPSCPSVGWSVDRRFPAPVRALVYHPFMFPVSNGERKAENPLETTSKQQYRVCCTGQFTFFWRAEPL